MEHQSRDEKKLIVTKDVVGLHLGEVVSTRKIIVAMDVVGLLLGEVVSMKKNTHRRKECSWLTSRIVRMIV